MAYISGFVSEDATVVVLDSNYNKIISSAVRAGNYTVSNISSTTSGIVFAVSNAGALLGYSHVIFMGITIPYTEQFNGSVLDSGIWTDLAIANPGSYNLITLDGSGNALPKMKTGPNRIAVAQLDNMLGGNFSVTLTCDSTGLSYTEGCFVFIRAYIDSTHVCDIRYGYLDNGTRVKAYQHNGNSNMDNPFGSNRKIKLTRSGGTVTYHSFNGSSWSTINGDSNYLGSGAVTLTWGVGQMSVMGFPGWGSFSNNWGPIVDSISIDAGTIIE